MNTASLTLPKLVFSVPNCPFNKIESLRKKIFQNPKVKTLKFWRAKTLARTSRETSQTLRESVGRQ